MKKLFIFLFSFLLFSGNIFSQEEKKEDVKTLLEEEVSVEGWQAPQKEITPSYPYIEHHGYFRFRSDFFHNLHLGTNYITSEYKSILTSGFKPPLTENAANNSPQTLNKDKVGSQGESSIASANMRFRYTPTLHIAGGLKITLQLDVLDNIVLGSTPDYYPLRPDAPLQSFSNSQAPPQGGKNAFKDSVSVKQAYGEWQIMFDENKGHGIGVLRFGRMASHWGLGVLANGGQDIDSDWGDFVDRVLFITKFFGTYIAGAWDWVSEGVVSESDRYSFGQPHDMENKDDVDQWIFTIFQRPLSEKEKEERRKKLEEDRKIAFDWGFYGVYRKQNLDTTSGTWNKYLEGEYDYYKSWDQFTLIIRDGWAVIPDLWFKIEYMPDYGKKFRFEMEGVMIYGKLKYAFEDQSKDSEREIIQYGAAIETDWTTGGLTLGLDGGFASGDESEYFAFYDQTNFADPKGEQNKRVSNFKFDPDYHIDLILFREVIGTITNAFYFKPRIQYDLFDSDEEALGARLDILYARALEKTATPGDSSHLGIETDLRLFYEQKNRFLAILEWGMLWPGSAFNLIPSFEGAGVSKSASWATTLQFRLGLIF